MHSHDRTMWASLAGGDKDKANTLHGLACRYLTEPEQALRLLAICNPVAESWTVESHHYGNGPYDSNEIVKSEFVTYQKPEAKFIDRSLEHPINKGQGQYRTTVGFLDAVANYEWEWSVSTCAEKMARAHGPVQQFGSAAFPRLGKEPSSIYPVAPTELEKTRYGKLRVLVEVKIHPVDVDEVLRQVRLYQQYVGETYNQFKPSGRGYITKDNLGNQFWVLAVRFDISAAYRSVLEEHGIKVVQLATKFDEWVAAYVARKNGGDGSAADEI